jgi:hypothetical protein
MAEIKFSCAQCGQHISCDEPWAGHQIQCPACQSSLTVPHLQPLSAPAPHDPGPLISQPPVSSRPKLSAGSTQVTRSTPPSAIPHRQFVPRPPKTGNPILKYTVMAVVLVVIAVAAFNFLPPLLNQVQGIGTSKTPASGAAPAAGAAGPLGEVNGAMDMSDALEGGGSSRPRGSAARQPATSGTNSNNKTGNGATRAR